LTHIPLGQNSSTREEEAAVRATTDQRNAFHKTETETKWTRNSCI